MKKSQPADTLLSDVLAAWLQPAFLKVREGQESDAFVVTVVPTGNPEFGDYQCNDALSLAKRLKKNPRQVAEAVLQAAGEHPAVEKTSIAGPGFINISLRTEWLARHVEAISGDDQLGVPRSGEGHTLVLDYSSPNVAKPMHIGHIRSTIIGNSLDRMFRCLGYRVVSDNHIGDWGTQFGILIMGYRTFSDPKALQDELIEELERVYVKSYEQTKQDEAWLAQCRQELVKLQSGDAENRALWSDFVRLSLSEFDRIYKRLGVRFDLMRGESHYNDKLQGVIDTLQSRGLASESEGATVVLLEEEKLPVCIVRKSDGGFNYATTDLATVESRIAEFQPDRIVYVTDERQQLHFSQIFAICRRLGHTTQLDHVWFGLMRLPTGTFSTRQGNVIKLERLLDEAEVRALAIVQASSPDMPPDRQREVARVVGMGAIKYADLSQNPQTTVTFSWDKALALDGNSAPYLQYACARIASVRDKYRERFGEVDPDCTPLQLAEPIERTLAVKVSRFGETVSRAALAYKPCVLADYLYELSQLYSNFYQNVPFLKAEPGVRESRVRLCGIVARVLRRGLDLLGIETLDRI
jgi:arginyl-tRNA synthetase